LNARYYIDKQIVPALSRVFALIGVDVKTWCASPGLPL
jgi:DNA polymerase elongation subunit (family B)